MSYSRNATESGESQTVSERTLYLNQDKYILLQIPVEGPLFHWCVSFVNRP